MAARRTNSAMMETLRREALNLAGRAIEQDNSGNFEVAKRHYQEVVRLLGLIIERMGSQPSERNIIINKREEYVRRIEQLDSSILFSKAQAILKKAKSEEEQFKFVRALNSYLEAVEPLLQAQKHANDSLKAELRIQIKQTLDKAEPLKKLRFPPRPRNGLTPSSKLSPLTDTERKILLDTSRINEKIFLPWYDDDDLNEPFLFDKLFTDLDGPLQLSLQQKELFGSWKRPYQVMKNPVMIAEISSSNIVQDIVTDCSFVASLCVSAAYERRHNKQLITKCIYPQDEHGKPMYNPCGKYMIKLLCNGRSRKVVVDDLLPVSRDGTLMCTFSTNKDELWPSIVEKAYLKLMGGYDFPGSNSGIDLYALTEWLPEHIFITEAFDKESTWKRLFRGQKDGNVLVIISTGEMDEERANTVGLVPTHAYAVLDIREIKGLRLLQVKNPWSHKRWTGDFSHQDNVHWTPELMRALNYDRRSAARSDDGVFWIDFDSVCKYFDSIHVNENPGLFEYKDVLHASWSNTNIVNTDTFNIGNNPQYSLEIVNNDTKASAVRLLLTKHIITVGENKDHIALHVYNDTDGKKIFYPKDPMIQGLYVNSPHILVRFDAQPGVSKYTVVVAQHETSGLLYYTLRCFCQSPFTLCDVVDSYPIEKEVNGCWTQQTAGGHSSLITFLYNPQYKLSIKPSPESIRVRLSLEGPLSYAMNVKLVWSQGKRVASVANKDIVVQSGGEYRPAFCYCEKEDVQAGDYTIIVSTYDAGLCGDFKLTVASNSEFQISEIPSEGAGMFKKVINGQWIGGVSAMGHQGYRDYYRNPCYLLRIKQLTTVKIRLQARNITPIPAMNIKLFEARLPQHEDVVRIGKEVCSTGAYVEFVQGVCTDDVVLPPREEGYVIIFSTWERGVAGNFVAYVYSDGIISIEEISR